MVSLSMELLPLRSSMASVMHSSFHITLCLDNMLKIALVCIFLGLLGLSSFWRRCGWLWSSWTYWCPSLEVLMKRSIRISQVSCSWTWLTWLWRMTFCSSSLSLLGCRDLGNEGSTWYSWCLKMVMMSSKFWLRILWRSSNNRLLLLITDRRSWKRILSKSWLSWELEWIMLNTFIK